MLFRMNSSRRSSRPLFWAAIGLGIGFLLLFLIGLSAVWLTDRVDETSRVAGEAREQKINALHLLADLRAAESGQRGFIITRDAAYREPYERGRADALSRLSDLRAGAQGDARQTERVDRIEGLSRRKLAELAQTIALAEAGRDDDVRAAVLSHRGRDWMESIQAEIDGFLAAEDRRLAASLRQRRQSSEYLFLAIVAALSGIAAIAVGSAVVISRGFAALRASETQLRASQDELSDLNEHLEETIRERTGDLRRANQEIQRFAYIVSHDLRSPLVNVMGFTAELEQALGPVRELLARADDVSPELRVAVEQEIPEALRYIQSSTAKMDRLIGAILRLSREGRRPLTPQPVDLGALVRESADAIKKLADERGATISIEPLPRIVGDRLSLEQLFSNLIENAVKYGAPDRPNHVVVRGEERPREVLIEVSDTGRGIAPEDRERIFELFRRAGAQDQPGEGLGLAFVRAIARRLGGDVELDSEVNRGTTFRIRLPKVLRAERVQEAAE
jgi:signal transduction histidine kinase